nr:SpoIIE family protein phosphatase [Actinomycetota bacterium]
LQHCAEALVTRVDAAFARIWTLNEFDRVLELQASAGLYTHLDGGHSRVPVGRFKIGMIAEERIPHLTNDVLNDPRLSDPVWAAAEGMVSFAGYPLLVGGRLVGVIALFARRPLTADLLTALAGIADAVAVGIDRDRAGQDRERLLAQLDSQRSLMDAVIQQMPAGLIVAEAPSGRVVLGNRQLERILRHPVSAGGELSDPRAYAGFHPDGQAYQAHEWPLARTIRTGEVIEAEAIQYRLPDGTFATIEISAAPVRDATGGIVAGVVTFRDVTERRRAERRLAAQHAATTVLAGGATLEDAAGPFLLAVCDALRWEAGSILEVDEETALLRTVAVWNLPGVGETLTAETGLATFRSGDCVPGRVWESGAPVVVADMGAETSLPRSAAARADGIHAAVAVPITAGRKFLGVLEIFRRGQLPADKDLVRVMTSIGRQLGQFTERSRAEAAVHAGEARKVAMLETSLDCIVSIDDRGLVTEFNPAAERTFGWRRSEIVGRQMADFLIPHDLRPEHHRGFDHYLRTGEGPVLGQRVELRGRRRDGTEFPIELAVTRIPTDGAPAFTAYIRDITERQQAARALYESREEFATLARTLQKSLLPPDLPNIAGVTLAARYHPAVEGLEVGGDFYDVFRTGRSGWAVVIGDVCGKGAEAASLTGLARYTIRAAAMQTTHPARVLSMLNEAILRQEGALNERFATVVYASLARRAGATMLTVACGGHPPPLVVRPDGAVATVGVNGTLLGALRDPDLTEVAVRLEAGDKVVFHTDGVLEAPGPGGEFGAARLRELLATCGSLDVAATAARLEAVVLEHQGGVSRDDMAILVLGLDA